MVAESPLPIILAHELVVTLTNFPPAGTSAYSPQPMPIADVEHQTISPFV